MSNVHLQHDERIAELEASNKRLTEALKKAPMQYLARLQALKAEVNALKERLDEYEA